MGYLQGWGNSTRIRHRCWKVIRSGGWEYMPATHAVRPFIGFSQLYAFWKRVIIDTHRDASPYVTFRDWGLPIADYPDVSSNYVGNTEVCLLSLSSRNWLPSSKVNYNYSFQTPKSWIKSGGSWNGGKWIRRDSFRIPINHSRIRRRRSSSDQTS